MTDTRKYNKLILSADLSLYRDTRAKGKGCSIYTIGLLRKYGQKEFDMKDYNVILEDNLNTKEIRGDIEEHTFKNKLKKLTSAELIYCDDKGRKVLCQNYDPCEGYIELDIEKVLKIKDDFDLLVYAGIVYNCGYYGGIYTATIPALTQKLGYSETSSTRDKVRESVKRLEEQEYIFVRRYKRLNIKKGQYDIQDFSMKSFNPNYLKNKIDRLLEKKCVPLRK